MTSETLKNAMPGIDPCIATEAATAFTNACNHYGITTAKQQAMLIANIAHESNSLRSLSENLNYGHDGLLKTFPKYFTLEQAKQYARQPERIANRVYADRYGNGNEVSGDGWRYRGAGALQTTFKNNHQRAANEFGKSLSEVGNWLRTVPGAIWGACYFWKDNGLNLIAEKPDLWKGSRNGYTGLTPFDYCCIVINGGVRGLTERRKNYTIALRALS